MTLYKLVQDVCNLGKAQPNVNFVTQGDIYQLNHNQDVDYPAFVVTQGTHTGSDYDEEQFTLTLFAVDRLVSDKSNEIDVQSWANSVLLSVIKNIGDFFIGTVQPGFKIQTFTEKFDSLCAGAYVTLAIDVDINDCDCVSKSIGFVTSVNGQTGDVTIKGYEGSLVSSVNGQTGDVNLNIPYKVSDLRNDVPYASESFVNNKITDVSTYVSNNYLKKGEVPVLDNYYTKQEVDDKIRDVSVQVDLSNYYTKSETYNKQEIETKIAQAGGSGGSSVTSVNGQTGDVILNYVDISVYNQLLEEFNQLNKVDFIQHLEDFEGFKYETTETTDYLGQAKQDKLVSGTNIKTINGLSLLGSGDIVINGSGGQSTGGESTDLSNYYTKAEVDDKITDVSTYVTTYVYDNYYTIPEVDDMISNVSVDIDLSNYYTKAETYNKQEVYNKQEIETKIAQAGVSSVNSVNGQTGDVILNYVDISVYNQLLEEFNQLNKVDFIQHLEDFEGFKYETTETTDYLGQAKQDKLVSGTNIKTINGLSLLGEGNIAIQGGESTEHVNLTLKEYNNLSDAEKLNGKVYFITDISYCLYSDYQNLYNTVNALKNRVNVLENSIKSPQNNS